MEKVAITLDDIEYMKATFVQGEAPLFGRQVFFELCEYAESWLSCTVGKRMNELAKENARLTEALTEAAGRFDAAHVKNVILQRDKAEERVTELKQLIKYQEDVIDLLQKQYDEACQRAGEAEEKLECVKETLGRAWWRVANHEGIEVSAKGDEAAGVWNNFCALLDPFIRNALDTRHDKN